ncbi:MAG TPA: hypothetical protein VJ246_02755, partial [Patescibacteria group bacterium]|nr:hypothetical protein [Patescibacteria group bacterium]
VVASHSSAPDNSYLHVLQSLGIPGLFIWMLLLFSIMKRAKTHPAFIASFTAFGVSGLFNNTLFYPWVMAVVWLMVAIQEERT